MSVRQKIIPRSMQLATIQELRNLLQQAEQGDLIGLAYIAQPTSGQPFVGSAGALARDALRTSGAFLTAAVGARDLAANEQTQP